jgi:hypothetical protein
MEKKQLKHLNKTLQLTALSHLAVSARGSIRLTLGTSSSLMPKYFTIALVCVVLHTARCTNVATFDFFLPRNSAWTAMI